MLREINNKTEQIVRLSQANEHIQHNKSTIKTCYNTQTLEIVLLCAPKRAIKITIENQRLHLGNLLTCKKR